MNFKKLTMVAVLAATQTAMVLPAGAEAANTNAAGTSAVHGVIVDSTSSTDNQMKASNMSSNGNIGSTDDQTKSNTSDDSKATVGKTETGADNESAGNDSKVSDTSGTGTEGNSTTPDAAGTTENQGNTNDNSAAGNTDQSKQGSDASDSSGNTSEPGTSDPSGTDAQGITQTSGTNELVLMMNSNKMYHNGKLYLAGQPMAVKNGVSYVAIRAMVERVGLKLSYDNKTKETIIIKGDKELRFKTNSNVYRVNGETKPMKGPSYQEKDVFMVPLTSITQALNIPYTVDQPNKRVILNLVTKPVATFTMQPAEIFAGDTVYYESKATSPNGLPIVNERWEGKEDIFQAPGTYTVTHYVQDSSGQWSDPYTFTVNVLKANEPPVAKFTTDKEEYKMGEPITITDLSTDDEDAIVDEEWLNNYRAFFEPGPVTIRLKVTDKHGAVGEFNKTITITNETMYTKSDFDKLFTPVGEKYSFDGGNVPSWNKAQIDFTSDPATLIRSNSPETVYSEGILYTETALGSTRFMIHHLNSTSKNMKVYLIATNTNNDFPSVINVQSYGMGGPSIYPEWTGNVANQNYFKSLQDGTGRKDIYLQPGETKVIMTELSDITLKPGQAVSMFADAFSNYSIKYNVVMVAADKDPVEALPFLSNLERDVHNRGTYPDSIRNISYDQLIGSTPTRMVLGDNKEDPNLRGLDGIQGTEASNAGNFGVLYKIKFTRVAPNTLITFNPRGGFYSGPVMVNGQIVPISKNGAVNAPNETSVLYRTGDFEQTVEIWFTPAPGSNLPVNLLFMPLPEEKK